MKAVRVIKNLLKGLVCLVYTLVFVVCCYSWPAAASNGEAPAEVSKPLLGTPNVSFAAGSFPIDSQELTLVLQPGETALLDSFTELRSLDLTGSRCYEEFIPWIQAHPEVEARYTVVLPDGSEQPWDVETLSMPGLDSAGAAQLAPLLAYLPSLKSVDLGSQATGGTLLPADVAQIQAACPELELNYVFNLAGQEIRLTDESLALASLSHADVAQAADIVSCMKRLGRVDLGGQGANDLSWEDIGALQAANPEAEFAYSFSLYGKNLTTLDDTLDFNHIPMDDRGDAVRAILPYMQNCKLLDMDFCEVSDADMAAIRADFPDIKVVWRIWFGENYSVRTDVERILASKPSKGGNISNDDAQVLRYCTDVKYLDLGHNERISDISFVNYMPNLEVLVMALNPLVDISPLANCPKLEYLELNSTEVTDLRPLSGLTELRHLNIGNCENVYDISPLYPLKDLERLWIGCIDPVPPEQVAEMQAAAPNCEINTEVVDPTAGHWRIAGYTELSLALYAETGWLQEVWHPRYELLHEQFGYTDADYAFYWNDPLYEPHD